MRRHPRGLRAGASRAGSGRAGAGRAGIAAIVGIVCALLAGCTAAGVPDAAPARITGQWILVDGNDGTGRLPLNGTYVTLTVGPGDTATGRSPCTDYTARVIGRPGPVFVTVLQRDISPCVGVQRATLDSRYLKALGATSIASLDGDDLLLRSRHTSLRFHRADRPDLRGILGITWTAQYETITAADGTSTEFSDPSGGIRLAQDGTFGMNVGQCPPVTGRWSVNAGETVLDHLAHSTAACTTPDDEQNRIDVMSALVDGFQFSVEDGTLATMNPRNHNLMTFVETAS